MKKPLFVAALAAAILAGGTAAPAQAPSTPEVGIALGRTAVTLTGAESLQGGPTKITFTNPDGVEENFGGLYLLRDGLTAEEFQSRVAAEGQRAVWWLGTMEASAALVDADATHSTTVTLQPGGTYVAFQAVADDPEDWILTSFTVGTGSNGASLPEPDATVDMDDFVFAGDKRLPREGTIRFRNVGTAPHFSVAFPLKAKARFKKFRRLIMRNKERQSQRLVGGPPTEIQGIVSGGAVNTTDLQFARAGRYALVCFFSTADNRKGHHEIGMVNQVRVR
jgi:hypothetical protein